ncbi:hypothetical protein QA641_20595 [Bradyrhizobium sp. CB1650]|uniref:hypothetical protein n=1 Tax=Bradyrhizobium sp. CB1650 TaxID=3039153 RepID=UPI0024360F0D|nr:hypothetical protein [Bradyrhizobium sp. CB1650]WGD56081.1 hypothetical protein QA641_20595 [Bradyrhizobium sp. CB1650]
MLALLLRGVRVSGLRMKRSSPEPRICPECRHVFQGNDWDGIDAHWRAKHDDLMRYKEAWPLTKSGQYKRTTQTNQTMPALPDDERVGWLQKRIGWLS